MNMKGAEMIGKPFHAVQIRCWTIAVLVCALVGALPIAVEAQEIGTSQAYGIAAKRPVLQAACRYCPWGVLGDVVKKIMAPYGYDVAICYSCSGVDSVRIVSRRLIAAEISDRQFAEGTLFRPEATIDFGITQLERVRSAYEGMETYQKDGPLKNLRIIARIESPSYLMVAAVKSSGITDLRQIRERKMPVRIMMGVGGGVLDTVLDHYGITRTDVKAWGGTLLEGNALLKNPNFDLIMGVGILANYPEGNMWYEMTQKKDLVFFPIPEDLRQKLVKENRAELVDLPFRYMRGVGDAPLPTVGLSGLAVYGRDDLPDSFVRDVAKALDEKHALIKWTSQPFSYDPATVWNGQGVPLHPAAASYYLERGYMK
jgi:TRAP-type uncharacterized transport system substrate-binding protein